MAIYCRQCGNTIAEGSRFCSSCGVEVAEAAFAPRPVARQLVRPRAGRMLAGVCQGIANQYGADVAWVRVAAVLLAFFSGIGLIAYVVFWVVTPEEPLSLPSGQTYTPSN